MTNEELQQHIKAIEGALKAGEVQQIDDDDYLTLGPDDFITLNIPDFAYRIKPEPREFTLQLGAAGNIIPSGSLHGVVREVIRVREVIDE